MSNQADLDPSGARYFATGNPVVFNPDNGTTGSETRYQGPLHAAADIYAFRPVGFAVTVIPSLSVNEASGTYSMA
jgi:hypothetical protein